MKQLLAVLVLFAIPACAEIPWGQTVTQGDTQFTANITSPYQGRFDAAPMRTVMIAGQTADPQADQYRITLRYQVGTETFPLVSYVVAARYYEMGTAWPGTFSHAQIRAVVKIPSNAEVTEITIEKGRFQSLGSVTLR